MTTKTQAYTYREMQALQALPLADKVMRAEQQILYELKTHHTPCVACSWGKASTVLVHMVRRFCKKALIMFNNTGVEYPQTYAYRDRLLAEWGIEHYVENKPVKSFWQCVREYGYPKYRLMAIPGKVRKNRTPRCCYYCKELPARQAIKRLGVDLQFVGLQASESMVRRLSFLREGECFDSTTYGCRLCRPLMTWTDQDIWDYHAQHQIPRNPLYALMDRNGCMPCTGFKRWREVMAAANPKLYAFVSRQIDAQRHVDCDVPGM